MNGFLAILSYPILAKFIALYVLRNTLVSFHFISYQLSPNRELRGSSPDSIDSGADLVPTPAEREEEDEIHEVDDIPKPKLARLSKA